MVDTVVETKLDFQLVKTTGHCSTVHGKFLVVLYFLFTTTSTDTLASTGTRRLVGVVVKASTSRAEDLGFESRLRQDFFRGRVIPVTYKLTLQLLPSQAPGVIGSVLGLVGPVSVYCDWVRWEVGSAASISVWQHVKLSEQICP